MILDNMDTRIKTFTGKMVSVTDLQIEDICIEDIAHALSNICRFTGHTPEFYSVAQHSVMVADLLPKHLALEGLLHDATEAYISDVASPVKRHPAMVEYRTVERQIDVTIRKHFILPVEEAPEVKQADDVVLISEALSFGWPFVRIQGNKVVDTDIDTADNLHGFIHCMTPRDAEKRFLEKFRIYS